MLAIGHALAAVSLSTTTAYTQNFDGMGTPATATTSSNLPADFRADALTTVRTVGTFAAAGTTTARAGGANLSTSAANGIYNFGSGAATLGGADRAVGFLSSGTATQSGNLYAQLSNNTGSSLSGLQISYDVEKYRNGLNPAGFRIQLFYSTDGATWTNAGSDFLTSFAANGDNNGFATVPGATSSVTNKTLNATIPNGGTFYLAWNYSVASGSTTTNAQALAIDNISILGVGAGGSTNPSGTGSATPNSVAVGSTTLLTVAVTPGTTPASTALAVSADLSSIGGSNNQAFHDDGLNGDAQANDNIFSFNATVANSTTGGAKSLPVTITDGQSRTGNTSISLTVLAPTSPTGVGSASPNSVAAGGTSLLTVALTPGTNPASTGLTVVADLSSIGGSATQTFFDDGSHGDAASGNNVFSFSATVNAATTPGVKTLPFTVADAQSRTGSGNISLTITQPPVAPGTVVVSQLYGGGGNVDAPYTNDYIEIFNRSNTTVSLAGWSVQYASSAGSSWQTTALTGSLAPGQFYLVREGSGTSCSNLPCGSALAAFDASGGINMAAASGKVAVVSSTTALSGTCPTGTNIIDFIGYGGANCFEGAAAAPGLDNTSADFRTHTGCKDTDSNGGNFTVGAPNPRTTATAANVCPTGDFPPEIFSTSPAANQTHIAVDSDITINFDEPVNVSGNWYQISCATTGTHTATASGGPLTFTLNPDVDFAFNEPCTVTVFASQVTDQDANDPPDNMAADYTFTFNSDFLRDPAEHMVMGNPNGATSDVSVPDNYLIMKPQYAFSYNNSRGIPNWTSWHLDSTWRGSAPRQDDFRPDTSLPPGFHQVLDTDYSGSGFDRGHMCPSADRTSTIPDNSATFLMSNMVPQAPGNNQGPWAAFENYLRTLITQGQEIYILSGGAGTGGTGSNQPSHATNQITTAGGPVAVPAYTWKVALILPVGDNDVARVDENTRTIAVIMPNNDNIRPDDWQKYLATVDQVEALSGYDFYSNVPVQIQDVIEARLDAGNDTAPVTADQSTTTSEDTPVAITLSATDFNVNNVFSFTVVGQPAHGTVTGSGSNLTYTPEPNYYGPDSFTFKANDGALDSTPSTVQINVTDVNDDPTASDDDRTTNEDTPLSFAASELTANDSAGPGESAQTLSVSAVVTTPQTHGTVVLSGGQITYTPAANYNGPASFSYQVCDDGTTGGAPDARCAYGNVNVTVSPVNDAPAADSQSVATDEDTPVNVALTGSDLETPAGSLTFNVTRQPAHGTLTGSGANLTYTPAADYNGADSFDFTATDAGDGTAAPQASAAATVSITIRPVNDAPVLSNVPASAAIDELSAYTFNAAASDVDVPAQTLTFSLVGAPAGASINPTTGQFTWTPTEAQGGTGSPYHFAVRVSDGVVNTDAGITINVNEVNQAPTLAHIGNGVVYLGGSLTFTASGTDADLPTQTLTYSLTGTVPSGASINASTGAFSWTPGAAQAGAIYTFGVRVTDNGAGLLFAEEQVSVGVAYTYTGVLQPINPNGGSIFKLGRTVPVKFRLTGVSAGLTTAVARLYVARVSDGVVGTEVEADSTSAATEGNLFRYDPSSDTYIFNLSTDGLSTGTYQLRIDMGDGVARVVNISLR